MKSHPNSTSNVVYFDSSVASSSGAGGQAPCWPPALDIPFFEQNVVVRYMPVGFAPLNPIGTCPCVSSTALPPNLFTHFLIFCEF